MKKLLLPLLLALTAGSAYAESMAETGGVTYPARGNIRWDEGTVELWITVGFDTDSPQAPYATFFQIREPNRAWEYVLNFVGKGSALAFWGETTPRQSNVWTEPVTWKAGEAHHIALTWSGRKRSLYVDGQVSRRVSPEPLQGEGREETSQDVVVEGVLNGDLTDAELLIGHGYNVKAPFIIDEVRISSLARPLAEIQKAIPAAPKADAHTLLLDHCDGGPAAVIAAGSKQKGATLGSRAKVVDAKHGKGIAVWTE